MKSKEAQHQGAQILLARACRRSLAPGALPHRELPVSSFSLKHHCPPYTAQAATPKLLKAFLDFLLDKHTG